MFNKYLITPFYHKGDNVWQYFAFLSLIGIMMLKKIREQGFESFKNRYQIKQSRTELRMVANKLGQDLQ